MNQLKVTLDRRVVLPIRERCRAEKHGLVPAGAILLFGPPGTGKTTLARAVAGRLGWAFIDVDLSLVALNAARLRRLFEQLFLLEEVIVFFDEFEYLGLRRDGQASPVEPLTAELLRSLPTLQDNGQVLVVCATNHIRLLDPALLRPGRFDLVLPVGLPDAADRRTLLQGFLDRHRCAAIDLAAVVARSAHLTLADLEAICHGAARAAFEREVQTNQESRIETEDLLAALDTYRATVSAEERRTFAQDVERFARY